MLQADDPPHRTCLLVSPPDGDRPLCTIALAGDGLAWTAEVRSTLRAIAAIVAAQIREASAIAGLAERRAVSVALIKETPERDRRGQPRCAHRGVQPGRGESSSARRRDDVLGQPMAELLMPERERDKFRQHAEDFLRSGDPGEYVGRIQVPVLRADGTERHVELTPLPLAIEGEVYFCGFLRDFTRAGTGAGGGRGQRAPVPHAGSAGAGRHRADRCRRPVRVRQRALVRADRDDRAGRGRRELGPVPAPRRHAPAGAGVGPGRGTRRRTAHRLPPAAGGGEVSGSTWPSCR